MPDTPAAGYGQNLPLVYTIPDGEAVGEIEAKRSIFVGSLGRARSRDQAMTFVRSVRERYQDANHNAWAFRLSSGPQAIIGSSDDGEPGGTAGRPMLAILEGADLSQVVAVGTRFWGGTKLGTGGLVRAYSGCVREALRSLPTVDMVLCYIARIQVDYATYGNLRYHLPQHAVKIENESFAEGVSLQIIVRHDKTDVVAGLLRDMTNGKTDIKRWEAYRYDRAK